MFKEYDKPPRRKEGTDRWCYKATPIDTWDGDYGIRKRFGCVKVEMHGKEKVPAHFYKLIQKVQTGRGFEIIEGAAAIHHIKIIKTQQLRLHGVGGVKSKPADGNSVHSGGTAVVLPLFCGGNDNDDEVNLLAMYMCGRGIHGNFLH